MKLTKMPHLLTTSAMMKIVFFIYASVLQQIVIAQVPIVPDDLSYDLIFTPSDLNLKGNVMSMEQTVSWKVEEPMQDPISYETDIYEEQFYNEGDASTKGITPIIDVLIGEKINCRWDKNGKIINFSWKNPKVPINNSLGGVIYSTPRYDISAEYIYSQNGLINSIKCSLHNKTISFIYDKQNCLIEKQIDIESSPFIYESVYPTKYEYDNQNRIVKVVTTPTFRGKPRKHTQLRSYNYYKENNNTIIESLCQCPRLDLAERVRKTRWVYDENMRLIEKNVEIVKSKNNKVEKKWSVSYNYNSKGLLKKTIMNDSILGNVTTLYNYDRYGNIIMIQNHRNNLVSIISNSYNYDDYGNWILKKTSVDDVFQSITTREIEYWE